MKKVLILEGFLEQSLGLAKILKQAGEFCIAGQVSNYLFYKLFYPRIYEKLVLKKNSLEIDFNHFDYIIPSGTESTYILLRDLHEIRYENGFIVKDNILNCYDKVDIMKKAEKIGIPVPKTFYSVKSIGEEDLPIFYKQKFESRGKIRGIAFNKSEIPNDPNLIYQEYINSNVTYGVGFLAQGGEILTYFMHKEILSIPPQGGSGVILEKFHDGQLLEYTKRLLKTINYYGWGLAEYKYCKKRRDYVFMEVNAKLWASCYFHFLNNPEFLNIIFGLKLKPSKVDKIVFINRYLSLPINEQIKSISLLSGSKIILERFIMFDILRKILPTSFKGFIKSNFIKKYLI